MGPNVILLVEPSIDRLLSLFDTVKPFGVEDLMTKDAIKAFVLAVFLRAALKDLDRRYISLCTPILRLLSNRRGQRRLSSARNIFDQQMTICDKTGQRQLHSLTSAKENLTKSIADDGQTSRKIRWIYINY